MSHCLNISNVINSGRCDNLKSASNLFDLFTKWEPLNIYEKCFLFHQKNSFCYGDFQNFVFLSSPLLFPVGHYLKAWSKVINKNLKNLISHFFLISQICYLEIETKINWSSVNGGDEEGMEKNWKKWHLTNYCLWLFINNCTTHGLYYRTLLYTYSFYKIHFVF